MTEKTTADLIASLDKAALRGVLVTMVAIFSFDVSDRAIENSILSLEGLYDFLQPVLEADPGIMREANSLACDLNE